MATRIAVYALLLGLVALPVAPAAHTGVCDNVTQSSVQVGAFHWWTSTISWEVWEESNDLPGLQRVSTSCPGADIPPDTCITHTEDFTLLGCVIAYPGTLP